jgi:peptidoglycan hydrolase-like protein with peptidoglycan-binding domain
MLSFGRFLVNTGAGFSFLRRFISVLIISLPLGILITPTSPASARTCNTTATNGWSNNCTVSEGNASNMVEAIQTVVKIYGAFHGYSACNPGTIDGIFGTNTFNAVECFQRHTGLSVDGIVGPNTWRTLQGQLVPTTVDGNWYYNAVLSTSTPYQFRVWGPSGVWYVLGLNGTYVQMNLSGPN